MLKSTFSPGAWPSLSVRQVGSHDCPFGACSGFTHVAACKLARPPFEAFCLWASSPSVTRRPRQIATEGVDFLLGRDLHPLVKCTFTAHAHWGHMRLRCLSCSPMSHKVQGVYNSASAKMLLPVVRPPETNTLPLGSSVAVWPA